MNNYKKIHASYNLMHQKVKVGDARIAYKYSSEEKLERVTVDFIPYPALRNTSGLRFYNDRDWKEQEIYNVDTFDKTFEEKSIEDLLNTIVAEGGSSLTFISVKDVFDFTAQGKKGEVDFWLIHENNAFFPESFDPAKRVYQKGGYFVMGFPLDKPDDEIVREIPNLL